MRFVKSKTLLLSALSGLIGFGAFAAEPAKAAPAAAKPEAKAPAAAGDAAGMALFEKKCGTSCHGKDGKGKTKMGEKLKVKDFTDAATWKDQTDESLTKSIVDGISDKKMPAFKDKLSADELKSLVAVLRTFQPK